MLHNGTYPGVNHAFKKIVHVGHSFGSGQTYAPVNMYPAATDGMVLTGFSMNSTYLGLFPASANFMLASLSQPLRLENVSGSMIESALRMYTGSIADYLFPIDFSSFPIGQNLPNGYITWSSAEAAKFLLFKPKYYAPGILDYVESTKQAVTLGKILTC
jgi:pimeloyl-ACP methyl ester carboxylesterase